MKQYVGIIAKEKLNVHMHGTVNASCQVLNFSVVLLMTVKISYEKTCAVLAVVVFSGILFLMTLSRLSYTEPTLFHKDKIDHVITLINTIEAYKEKNGTLPPEDKIITSETGGYYYMVTDGRYEVGFSIGFDYSCSYSSSSGTWSEDSVDRYYRKHK